jgi:hypothetical protein
VGFGRGRGLPLLVLVGLLIGTACNPCAAIDEPTIIVPTDPPAPQVIITVSTEALSGLGAIRRTMVRGTRRVTQVEVDGTPRTLVVTAHRGGWLLLDDEEAPADCPACAVLQVRLPLELAAGTAPLVHEPDEPLGRARVTVRVPVQLELQPSPSMPGVSLLIASHDPRRSLDVAPPQMPEVPEAIASALLELVEEVATFDAVKLTGIPLLRVRGWQVQDPALALGSITVRVEDRLVVLEAVPAVPLPGPGLTGFEVAPGAGQDLTWAIAPAYLAALMDEQADAEPPIDADGAPHAVRVLSIGPSSRGVSARLRGRRTEGCGWLEVESSGLRGTGNGTGGLRVLAALESRLVDSGGASSATPDDRFLTGVGGRAKELMQQRLAHPLVRGPKGEAPKVLIVRHEDSGVIFADHVFPTRRGRPRAAPGPPRVQRLDPEELRRRLE